MSDYKIKYKDKEFELGGKFNGRINYEDEANTIKDDYFTTTQEEKQFVIKKVNQ